MQLLIQNIIQAIRSLRSQGWQVGISAISLAVGIVSLTYSYNWLWSETNYDSFRPNYKELYLAAQTNSEGNVVNFHIKKETADTIDQVLFGLPVEIGSLTPSGEYLSIENEEGSETVLSSFKMDSVAFELLGIEVLSGDISEVLNNYAVVAISDSAAMRAFGTTDVIGKGLKSSWVRADTGEKVFFEIKAVFRDNDENRSLFNGLKTITQFRDGDTYKIIRTKDADEVRERLKPLQGSKLGEVKNGIGITPLRTASVMGNSGKSFFEIFFYNIAFTLISLLLVVSAVVNLIMVFTSIYLSRVREYALRRSMGASTWQNIQWMVTAIVPTLLFALLLSAAGMEWVSYWGDLPYKPLDVYNTFYRVAGATVAAAVLGLLFPIFKMRRAYRASFLGHGDGGRSHVWLIVVQCMASALLLFISLGMQRQIHAMVNAELGFERENILRLHTGIAPLAGQTKAYDFDPIFNDLVREIKNSGASEIVDVVGLRADIFNRNTMYSSGIATESDYKKMPKDNWGFSQFYDYPHFDVDFIMVPHHAFEFFGIKQKSGAPVPQLPKENDKWNVLLDSVAMAKFAPNGTFEEKHFGLSKARVQNNENGPNRFEGQGSFESSSLMPLAECEIVPIGEVNVRLRDFKAELKPILLVPINEDWLGYQVECDAIYVKYAPGRRDEAEAAIRRVLAKFDVPEEKIGITSFDRYIADCYSEESYYADMLSAFTLFSVVVTLAGVFSMLLYSLRLRRRSMAIHRVMGAGFKDIFVPVLKPYLIYAVVGVVVAYVPAVMLMREWMQIFHYGSAPGVGLMLSILLGMVLIITLIVWWQVRVCMREKPVEILKPES